MTNTLEPHSYYWNTLGLNNCFDRIFSSWVDHFMKPEQESYTLVLNKIGAKAEECVLIDDLLENVNGAISAGMKGIVYSNLPHLIADLTKLGIEYQS